MTIKIATFLGPFSNAARVLRRPRYLALAVLFALGFLALYLFIPVWLVPGNTLKVELGLITRHNDVLLAVLALITGALWTLQIYLFQNPGTGGRASATCGISLFSSIAGGVAAASCGCGYAIILGAFGFTGAAPFMLAHETVFVLALLFIVGAGLYLTARRLPPAVER